MKRVLKILLLAALFTVLLSTSAMAMDAGSVTTFDSNDKPAAYYGMIIEGVSSDGGSTYVYDDNFTVKFGGADASEQYVLLMVKAEVNSDGELIGTTPYSITADSILYVDQKMSGADKTLSFDVVPSCITSSVILLGGSFDDSALQSPVILGTVYVSGVEVSGTVALQGRTSGKLNGVTVALTPSAGDALTTTTDVAGGYSFSAVMLDDYKLTADKASYLSYEKTTLVISSNTVLNAITLKGGDIVKDGQVTSSDLSNLLSAYLSTTTAPSDINGDGQVTSSDLSILLSNYLVSKTVE